MRKFSLFLLTMMFIIGSGFGLAGDVGYPHSIMAGDVGYPHSIIAGDVGYPHSIIV